MPDEVKFAVGDRVRFKPEDYDYRDQQRAPEEFVIVRIVENVAYWDWYSGAFFERLTTASGPW